MFPSTHTHAHDLESMAATYGLAFVRFRLPVHLAELTGIAQYDKVMMGQGQF